MSEEENMQNGQQRRDDLLTRYNAIAAERVAELIPDEIRAQLLANGKRTAEGNEVDTVPLVRLFAPDGKQSWLLTELDPSDGDTAYGLCDLGMGTPECGAVSLKWLTEQTGPAGMHIERDLAFPRASTPTLDYLDRAASAAGRIVL